MIEIDGSYGEAGGQILRTALAFSVLTGKSFKIKNIRKNRPSPGLKNQHIACIKLLKLFSKSECKQELKQGLTELEIYTWKI